MVMKIKTIKSTKSDWDVSFIFSIYHILVNRALKPLPSIRKKEDNTVPAFSGRDTHDCVNCRHASRTPTLYINTHTHTRTMLQPTHSNRMETSRLSNVKQRNPEIGRNPSAFTAERKTTNSRNLKNRAISVIGGGIDRRFLEHPTHQFRKRIFGTPNTAAAAQISRRCLKRSYN